MSSDTPIINEEIVNKTKEKMIDDTEVYQISDFFKIFGDSTRLKIKNVIYSLDDEHVAFIIETARKHLSEVK